MPGIAKYIQIFRYYASAMGPWQTLKLIAARSLSIPSVNLSLKGIKSPIKCRTNDSDRLALAHVFIERDCDISVSSTPHLIIDGGANVGYASVMLANKYPNAKIIAIEPDTNNLKIARENCRAYPNVQFIQGGIWSSDTHLAIQNPEAESWGFQVEEVSPSTQGSMRGLSLQTLLKESGCDQIDILKLDIEGAEEAIFSAPDVAWLRDVNNIVVEVHGEKARAAVFQALAGHTFVHSEKGEKHIFSRAAVLC